MDTLAESRDQANRDQANAGGLLIAVGIVAALLAFGGVSEQTRAYSEFCYEQGEPEGVDPQREAPLQSSDVSAFPFGVRCLWYGRDGNPIASPWIDPLPTIGAYGGTLAVIGGAGLIVRSVRRPRPGRTE